MMSESKYQGFIVFFLFFTSDFELFRFVVFTAAKETLTVALQPYLIKDLIAIVLLYGWFSVFHSPLLSVCL